MDELQVAVCEDNPEEFEKLFLLIQDSGFSVNTDVFESGEAFLRQYRPGFYDLILMDIYLDGISGVEAVQAVRQVDPDIPIAFTTTSKDHALEGYRLDVVKYMEKPLTEKAVQDILKLALEKRQNAPGFSILQSGRRKSVPFGQILYIEQKAHDLLFHLSDGSVLHSRGKLDDIESSFPASLYLRCHKSYLVNLAFVTGMDRELMVFHMKDNTNVHIRRESFRKAKDAWENWLFSMSRKAGTHYE